MSEKINPLRKYIRNGNLPHFFCPGCGCGQILNYFLKAVDDLKLNLDEIITIGGVGCTARIPVYLSTDSFHGVRTHIRTALKFLSDRKSPDYRNSIKESISAVESICQVLTGDDKATLGDALNKLENHFNLHGALKAGFKSLYGYTSDQDGIRHAILKEQDISFSDAKYMLVSCSAFANYLIGKVAELEIKIPDQNT